MSLSVAIGGSVDVRVKGKKGLEGEDLGSGSSRFYNVIRHGGDMEMRVVGVIRNKPGSVKDIASTLDLNLWMWAKFEVFADPHTSMA